MHSTKITPIKRRKLTRSSSSQSVATPIAIGLPTSRTIQTNTGEKGSCVSCHRGVNIITAGYFVQCFICSSTTCLVCSRTCTHSVPFRPPTPFLTKSPTPCPSSTPSQIIFAATLINLPSNPTPSSHHTLSSKRKNAIFDSDDYIKDQKFCSSPGCGNVVCRKCCWEDIRNGLTTCLHCYGVDVKD